MTQNSIIANFQEEIIGQLVVGNYIIKIGSSNGAIANVATTEEKPTLQPRSTQHLIPENSVENIVYRQKSVEQAIAALHSGQSVEFYSPSGFGKTILLSDLVHRSQITSLFGDGVIYLSPVHPYTSDILQSIWEVLYESNIPYKPIYNEIRQQLQNKKLLVVLDEGELIQDELQELMNAASNCTFLIASSKSRIQKKGCSLPLLGLSINEALILVERELQRSLKSEELPAAKSLCTILNGHPLHLKLAVASIREEGRTLAEIVSQLPSSQPGIYLIQDIVSSLSKSQRTILELLAVMDSVGLKSQQVTNILQLPESLHILENLCRRHLVQFNRSRYKVSKTIIEAFPQEWKLTSVVEKTIAYFVNWAEKNQKQPDFVIEELDVSVQVLELAVRNSHWQDVLRLVKAVESPIALSKRWGLWGQVLLRGLQASQATQDKLAEAWIMHQLGTCALCLEENSAAQNYLSRAIQLRESLDDNTGIAATRHNFSLLKNDSSPQEHDTQNRFLQKDTDLYPGVNTEDNLELSSVHDFLTRMDIVSENVSAVEQSFHKNISFLSPTKLIATGILASGGFLAWSNLPRFIPTAPATSSPEATTTTTPSPIDKSTPKVRATPSPKIEFVPETIPMLSPLPKHTSPVAPPIKPNFEKLQPTFVERKRLQSKPVTAPVPPVPTVPTVVETPQPTPTVEATPTPTFTSTPMETQTPTVEPSPNFSFTPIPTPSAVPTLPVEVVPTPEVRIIPSEESGS